jgi:uncharacterized membrane protein
MAGAGPQPQGGIQHSLQREKLFVKAAWLVLALFSLIHLFIPVFNHYFFRSVAFDYGVYNFAFYDYAHARNSPCTVYSAAYPITFFQDHFSLLLVLLSPFYWIFGWLTGTYTVLVLQWAMVIAGAWATWRLILDKGGKASLALAALLFYFFLHARYAAYRSDANLLTMGSALVPVFLLLFDKGKIAWALIIFSVVLVTREDFSLSMSFLCLFLVIYYRKDSRRKKIATALSLLALFFFVFILTVFIPVFLEDDNKKYSLFQYGALGSGPAEAIAFLFTHPLDALRMLFENHLDVGYYDGIKSRFYYVYLVSGGILLFLRPWYLIPFLPLVAKKMYNDMPIRWSLESYYAVEVATLLPVMIFLLVLSLKDGRLRQITGYLAPLAALGATLYCFYVPPSNPLISESNKSNFLSAGFYQPEFDPVEARQALKLIPPQAAVSASCRFVPHLAMREKVYYFPNIADAQYIIVFKKNDAYPLTPEQFDAELARLSSAPEWRVIHEERDVRAYARIQAEGTAGAGPGVGK